MKELIWLVPLLPLIGFLLVSLGKSYLSKSLAGIIASTMVFGSFVLALGIFFELSGSKEKSFTLTLFDWISTGDFKVNIAFLVDPLSSIMLLIITGVGFLIHLYSMGYMHDDEGYAKFFSYLNLFVFFMLLLVLGDNFLLMFAGWEGVGLASYLLIGFWFKNQSYNDAAKKAFIVNRIGDLGFVLGIILIYVTFGTIQYSGVFGEAINLKESDPVIIAITLLLFVGAMGKSAQIPLYTWLPDAMAGPTPVSALIHAATMVTAGVYMIARSNILYSLAPETLGFVAIIGGATAVFAATIGIFQNDIKKILAYSTVSQLGYMFLALGVGAFTGGVFHLITHAFFKALLFLGAGSVIHAMGGEQDIRKMGGLRKYVPVTYMTFLLGTIAISGIPPFSGFFSKDEILAHAFEANPIFWVLGVLGSMMTTFYMFRLFFLTFFGTFRGTEEQKHHLHESPKTMTIPLIVLAVLATVAGFIGIPEVLGGNHWLEHFLHPVFKASETFTHGHKMEHSTEFVLMGVTVTLTVLLVLFARHKFVTKNTIPANDEEKQGFIPRLLANKYYVDEFYNAIIVKPLNGLAQFTYKVLELKGIDFLVNAVGKAIVALSGLVRRIQTGNTGFYIFAMVVSIIVILVLNLFNK
ncbi:MAG: NADH-quinone oxidoreductase subunit L [Crocinitomicaceae bacterium]|nr:NADH-quinone oxidoreductase subunit L [Crocinitomicaceae bacterium]